MTLPKRVIDREIDGRESAARAGSAVCAYSSAGGTEDGGRGYRGQRIDYLGQTMQELSESDCSDLCLLPTVFCLLSSVF